MIVGVLLLFALGLVVGSFLNVVISRLGTAESLVRGRSHCIHCSRVLDWFELVPVVSFWLQKGQCRSCHKPIPVRYTLVEIATGLLFVLVGWAIWNGRLVLPGLNQYPYGSVELGFLMFPATFAYFAFFVAGAVAISFYDWERHLISKTLVWPLVTVGWVSHLAAAAASGSYRFLFYTSLSALIIFGFFWLIWFFSGGTAMGRGDADVALAISIYLGPRLAAASLVLAFWLGAIWGLALVGGGRLGWKSQIAFAPFLFLGAFVALAWPFDFLSFLVF